MSRVVGAMTSSSSAAILLAAGRWLSWCAGKAGDGRRRSMPAWPGGSTVPVGSSSDTVTRGPAGCRGSPMHAILCESPPALYVPDMNDMTLPPELERFAAEAIAAGRYRDKAELLAA